MGFTQVMEAILVSLGSITPPIIEFFKKKKITLMSTVGLPLLLLLFVIINKRSDSEDADQRQKDIINAIESPKVVSNVLMEKMAYPDSIRVNIRLLKFGGKARDFLITYAFISRWNGEPIGDGQKYMYRLDESKELINNNDGIDYLFSLKLGTFDTLYVFVGVYFNDQNHIRQEPVSRIFQFSGTEFGRNLQPAYSTEFGELKYWLFSRDIWE